MTTILLLIYSFIFQVNDEYLKTLEILSRKIKFVEADVMAKSSRALKDVQPEMEKLRQKAVSKVLYIRQFFTFFLFFATQ